MTTENQNQMPAATEGCAAAAGYADGRPNWDELCDCATICRTLRPKGMNESLEHFEARAAQTLRTAYEHGADWNYNADCPHCDTGRKHTNQAHPTAAGGTGGAQKKL